MGRRNHNPWYTWLLFVAYAIGILALIWIALPALG